MRLYHFTAGEALRGIAQYGLTVGDVPTDIDRERGRIGVWFTTSPEAGGHGLEGSALDKARFRLEVEAPETALLVRWVDWAPANVSLSTREALRLAASEEETWFVFFGVVKPELIVTVTDMLHDEDVHDWPTFWPESDSRKGIPAYRREAWQKSMLKSVRKVLRAHKAGA